MGFGVALDSVLEMTEEERGRVSRAFGETLRRDEFTPPTEGEES